MRPKYATLVLTIAACTDTAPRMQRPDPLDLANTLERERLIGPQYAPPDLRRAVKVRDVRELLVLGIAVPSPRGAIVDAADTTRRAQQELAKLLGGWFDSDLAQNMTAHADLWSAEERADYLDMGIDPAKVPPVITYRLAFSKPPWNVQATGVPGHYHAIVLFQLLPESRAIGEGGHPASWPVGQVEHVLAEAAPRLNLAALRDRSSSDEASGYPFYRSNDQTVVRARVGERLDEKYAEAGYFFGIRINLLLK